MLCIIPYGVSGEGCHREQMGVDFRQGLLLGVEQGVRHHHPALCIRVSHSKDESANIVITFI